MIFLYPEVSKTGSGSHQVPIRPLPRAVCLGVKWTEREANHSPPSNPRLRMNGAINLLPHSPSSPERGQMYDFH